MAKTKTQKKNYQAWREGRRNLEDDNLFSKYSNRFKRKKQVDGKWVDWDIRTDAPWNPEAAWNTIYQNVYGTETPMADHKYLQAKDLYENEQSRIKNDAFANIRRQFSPKTVNEGERQIDIKRNETALQKEAELAQLRQDSSFRIDHESVPNWEGGDFEATDGTESLTDQADARSENPWMPKANPNIAMQGGNTVFLGSDTEIFNQKELLKERYAGKSRLDLAGMGNGEYESNYQNAIKQKDPSFSDFEKTGTEKHWKDMSQWERLQAKVKARGWPAKIAKLKREQSTFGITRPIDSEWNQPTSKDPNQTSSKDSIELPSNAEYGTGGEQRVNDWVNNKGGFEQNVGSEIKNTGEGGEVFTTPTPLSEEYKSLFSPSRV